MSNQYDIVVLGGGTGGYVAAIRAAQLGKTVAIVERDKLGGTCLHRGCIPSKALLRSAELYAQMKQSEDYGIVISSMSLDYPKVLERKRRIVDQLHKGVQYLMNKNKIEVIEGNGRIIGPSIFSPRSGSIAVELVNGETETIVPQQLIIATGSRPKTLPGLEIDGEFVLTSDEALQMEALPSSVLIIGGGVIGVEWASMLNDFGIEVTLVEYDQRILPMEDEEISTEMARILKRRGIKIHTGTRILPETVAKETGGVRIEAEHNEQKLEFKADKIIVCVGRQANVENIGLENTDVRIENGVIKVNKHLQTAEPHIYAIGDVIGGLQLAHAATHEALAAVDHIAGLVPNRTPDHQIPRCIYTRTEAASTGWTEQQAREKGFDVKVGKFPFKAIGKALVHGESDGFVKVVADKKTNDLLGVHMIGPHVTDYISEGALAQLLDATPWEVAMTIHPHPTLSEILGEAMLAVDGQAIGM
ncbi:dihydrolipoyl dehydrogenase [Paenibacillus sp. J2TS4]|uniref:dihydrolipoyl dehydrogenase n=1 Tax=Paenibacillus sp. J2TS4 TaxID=2807194 RepID=UPI001B085CE5|nr:dihydrolipoyl dehydrogenase [Paenibacillus sp. J2TS4]GIP32291.1 dihydrolipoyl dehydrogenase [Paenibacillus sp. J2TS4]